MHIVNQSLAVEKTLVNKKMKVSRLVNGETIIVTFLFGHLKVCWNILEM